MNQVILLSIICCSCALAIITYGIIRCHFLNNQDPLTVIVYKNIDGWYLSHIAFFAVLAYLFPSWPMLILIALLGILWEFIESFFAFYPPTIGKCKYDTYTSGWWYARSSDIIANTIGMVIGVALRLVT